MKSPKDYLTDRVGLKIELRKKLENIITDQRVMVMIEDICLAFLTETIQQSMEVGREKEVCICAAIKMPDGYIVRGHRHNDCIHTIYGIKRYQTGLSKMYEAIIEGFITTRNRFVDRKEGLKLQMAAGIKSADREGKYRGDELYSEDLY